MPLYKIIIFIYNTFNFALFSLLNSLLNLYRNCDVATTFWKANDPQYAEKLWNVSCRLLQLEPEEDFATFLETVSRQML